MRQAGRSLPEYHAVRGSGSILNVIADPDRATEITLQPVKRYGVDAAILYSDIVVPVHAIGFGIDITAGVGPTVPRPFASSADLARLRALDPSSDTPYMLKTIQQLTSTLDVPLIGFAGAPFTVATYLVEGGPSRHQARTKTLMTANEPLWHQLMERLTDIATVSLLSQIEAGASAVQLFDSWAGSLSPSQYRRYVAPYSARILEAVGVTGVPRIHFGVNTGELLNQMSECSTDVVGVDFRVPLNLARERVAGKALQGNLDPALILAGTEVASAATRDVLEANGGHPGYVFNLGHGVLPASNPEVLAHVVKIVHEEGVCRH